MRIACANLHNILLSREFNKIGRNFKLRAIYVIGFEKNNEWLFHIRFGIQESNDQNKREREWKTQLSLKKKCNMLTNVFYFKRYNMSKTKNEIFQRRFFLLS